MNARDRNILITCGVVLAIALAIWLFGLKKEIPRIEGQPQKPSISPTPAAEGTPTVTDTNINPATTPVPTPTKREIKQRQEAQINMAYATPITVYGKVVDEAVSPIKGATVEIGIADKPFQTGAKHIVTTDGGGLFFLSDVRGIAFSVSASKNGYYSTDKSTGQRNVVVPANGDLPQPTKEKPVILMLRKQGPVVPLIFISSRQFDVPATGQAIGIDLATGRKDQGGLEVASWLGDIKQRPFNWRYQLSIPGGGLIERKGQFDFEAPVDGYQATAEINMPTTVQRWTSRGERQYFTKLPDGRYARFSIRFYPGQRNFVVIEGYVNPTAGSRNLEPDLEQTEAP